MGKKDVFYISLLLFLGVFFAPIIKAEDGVAIISGRIYNYDLNSVEDVIVSVNSTPKQIVVAQNSTYRLELKPGIYTITAKYYKEGVLQSQTTEHIEVRDNSKYNLDLVLFPDLSDEEDLLSTTGYVVKDIRTEKTITGYLIAIGIAATILGIVLFYGRDYISQGKKQKDGAEHSVIDSVMQVEVHPEISKIEVSKIEVTHEEAEPEVQTEKIEPKDVPAQGLLLDKDLQQVLVIISKQDGRTTQKEIRKELPWSESKISLMIAELEQKGLIEKIKKGRGNIIILKK